MGQTINTGLTSVTGSVTVSTTAPRLTAVWGSKVGVGNFTVGTVPAGKEWRIYSAALSIAHSAIASAYMYVGNPIGSVKLATTCGANSSNTSQLTGGYIVAAAAENVIISVTAGTGDLSIAYEEVTL